MIRRRFWRTRLRSLYRWADRLPRVIRSLAGIVLAAAGVAGVVLPVLGVWMVPLGLLLIALDIPILRDRVASWLDDVTES